jgi:dTDP-4-dehydrorhamnose reductase
MKVWVTGMSGMLGHAVTKVAQELGHAVTATTHEECPIDEPLRVKEMLGEIKPNVVINCAGVTAGRKFASEELSASSPIFNMVLSNALGPHVLAALCGKHSARLVHVSTDCVFSGEPDMRNDGPHEVADLPDPREPYARTKLAGEPSEPHVLVVRTSFVGVSGGLCKWLIGQNGGQVDGWENYRWNGTTVDAFAQVLVQEATAGHLSGVQHAASNEQVSKFWLLRKMAEVLGLEVIVSPVDTPQINRILKPTIELPPLAWALGRLSDD